MSDRTKAITAFCKLRRLQEANESGYVRCITCGQVVKWNECDGGHMVSRSNRATEVLHDNVWPQCVSCNRFEKVSESEFSEALTRAIGEDRVNAVLSMKNVSVKKDYTCLIREYQGLIRCLKREKGL
jgi:hypothetical protein